MSTPTPPTEKQPDEPRKENWQPLIDALAPHVGEIVRGVLANTTASSSATLKVESLIVLLGFAVVLVVGVTAAAAAWNGNFDTAERIAIPLISFAGGFGLGSRAMKSQPRVG